MHSPCKRDYWGSNPLSDFMITILNKNLFEVNADVHVNTVNCYGVMGKGIALQFKEKYPEMFEQYKMYCSIDRLDPGELHLYETKTDNPKYVFNAATKDHWKDNSSYAWIHNCLVNIRHWCKEFDCKSVAMPYLGCGNGGLDKEIVEKMIRSAFEKEEIEVYICSY